MRLQLCMPPQQISPSAARRSPWSSAISQALPKSLGDAFLIPFRIFEPIARTSRRVDADDAVGPDAELAEPLGDAAALADLLRTCLRSSAPPIAEPPPVGGQTGATTEPMTRFRERTLSASCLRSSSRGVDIDVRREKEEIHAVELDAVRLPPWQSGRASCPGRWSAPHRRTPCRRPRARRRYEALESVSLRHGFAFHSCICWALSMFSSCSAHRSPAGNVGRSLAIFYYPFSGFL